MKPSFSESHWLTCCVLAKNPASSSGPLRNSGFAPGTRRTIDLNRNWHGHYEVFVPSFQVGCCAPVLLIVQALPAALDTGDLFPWHPEQILAAWVRHCKMKTLFHSLIRLDFPFMFLTFTSALWPLVFGIKSTPFVKHRGTSSWSLPKWGECRPRCQAAPGRSMPCQLEIQ